jgi:long-chain acyl-CoA synthetase
LLRLFIASKLDVHFTMEHQFLVAINERSHIIGGVYYKIDEDARSAHLEKIVVAQRLRGKHVSHALMLELIKRLRSAGLKSLTTGFFRPDYFRHYGFDVDKRHAGLVLDLQQDSEPTETAG